MPDDMAFGLAWVLIIGLWVVLFTFVLGIIMHD